MTAEPADLPLPAGAGAGQRFRRKVLYIPGFDPFPPRRYRELYRRESAAQAEVSGFDISLSASPRRDGGYGWAVVAAFGDRLSATGFEVLGWSDLVRASMERGIPATYLQLLRTAWTYLSTGTLRRLARLGKGPVIAALYPAAMLVLQAVAAVLAALVAALAASAVFGRAAGALTGIGVAVVLLVFFRRIDRRLHAYYLMHDFAFSAGQGGQYPATLDRQIDLFADRIARELSEGHDEVLVVGHSSGACVAVSALARVMRRRGLPDDGRPALGLLTLGQAIPMISFLPGAAALRADLHDVSATDRIFWLDVTAPGDGCCFALCDPVAVTGVSPRQKRGPLVISAAFSQTLSPERWRRLRRRYFRLHFQYLCAFDRPGDYDYFRITAGPMTLAERFAERKGSASRIETPHSAYTDMVRR